MKSLTITSTRTAAGKTTVGLGIAMNTERKCGYFKPYGDHPVYSKKSLEDLDVMLFHDWTGVCEDALECTLGFDSERLLTHWNPEELDGVLKKNFDRSLEGNDMVLVETGRNYSFGGYMGIDSVSLAEIFGTDLLLVAEGNVPLILDKILAVSKCLEGRANLKGVVINKVDEEERDKVERDVPAFLERKGIKLFGILPKETLLERARVSLIMDKLNAKLVGGGGGLAKLVDLVQVGALTADQAMKMPTFYQQNKLLITGGDRVDLIFASLNPDTAGIVLTNNILPHPKVLAKADDMNIPILSVATDTYTTARMIQKMVAEIRPEEEDKRNRIRSLVARELDVEEILA